MRGFLMRLTSWWNGLATGMRVLSWVLGYLLVFFVAWLSTDQDWGAAFLLVGILLAAQLLFQALAWWVRRMEQRKGREMEAGLLRGISAKGGVDLDKGEADARARLRARWHEVYDSLHARGYDYYSFPWYLIVGPPQSGKTTSIQKSLQKFPIGETPVHGYGGTRDCNWFFTDEAIIIDTAGRYVEHLAHTDEPSTMRARDEEEWNSFLDLLRRMRFRSPINGVVLTLKVEDVLEEDATKRARILEMLTKALYDIEDRLRVRVPVYVLITMCDKLNGFVDFSSRLPGLADRTLCGWSQDGSFEVPFAASTFEAQFGQLCDRVDRLTIEFMEQDAGRTSGSREDLDRMDRLSAFPREFATLGPRLATILGQVFKPTKYSEQHFCRGVYFTSGLQEGAPVLSACRELLADRVSSFEHDDLEQLAGENAKAYFIADLYAEKIFKEQGLIRQTRRARIEQRRKRWIYSGAAAIVLLAFSVWVVSGLIRQRGAAKRPLDALLAIKKMSEGKTDTSYLLTTPAEGRDLLERMEHFAHVIKGFEEQALEATGGTQRQYRDSRDRVVGAYRKAYADHVIDPLLADFLALADDAKWFGTREQADALARALQRIHNLGMKENWDIERLKTLLTDLKPLHKKLHGAAGFRIDYGRIVKLADHLVTPSLQDRVQEALVRVQRRARARAGKVREMLAVQYFSYWSQFDGSDAAETSPDPLLNKVRAWQALEGVHEAMLEQLTALKNALAHEEFESSKNRELRGFKDNIQRAWSEAYAKLTGLKKRLRTARERVDATKSQTPPTIEELTKRFNASVLMEIDPVIAAAGQDKAVLERAKATALANLEKLPYTSLKNVRERAAYDRWTSELWTQLANMDRFVRYDGAPARKVFQKNDAFRYLQERDLETLVTYLVDRYALPDTVEAPAGAPAEYGQLLRHFRSTPVEGGLTSRAVSAFFAELRTNLKGDVGTAVARLVKWPQTVDKKDVKHPASRARDLASVTVRMRQAHRAFGDPLRNRVLFEDAKDADRELGRLARNYLVYLFLPYWRGGFVEHHVPRDLLDRFVEALEHETATDLTRQWIALPDMEKLIRIAAAQANVAEDWYAELTQALESETGTTKLPEDLKAVTGFWNDYHTQIGKTVKQRFDANVVTPLGALRKHTREEPLIATIRGQLERGAYDTIDLPGRADKRDPIVEVANLYASKTRIALARRPKRMWENYWKQLRADRQARALSGKYPLNGRRAELDIEAAPFDDARKFLRDNRVLKVLYELASQAGDLGGGDREQRFVGRCAALRDVLAATRVTLSFQSIARFDVDRSRVQLTLVVKKGDKVSEQTDTLHLNDKAPRDLFTWTPGDDHEIAFAVEGWNWRRPGYMRNTPHRYNLLALCFGYDPYPATGLDPMLRWIKVPFHRNSAGVMEHGHVVVGIRFKTGTTTRKLPDILPDLELVLGAGG